MLIIDEEKDLTVELIGCDIYNMSYILSIERSRGMGPTQVHRWNLCYIQ